MMVNVRSLTRSVWPIAAGDLANRVASSREITTTGSPPGTPLVRTQEAAERRCHSSDEVLPETKAVGSLDLPGHADVERDHTTPADPPSCAGVPADRETEPRPPGTSPSRRAARSRENGSRRAPGNGCRTIACTHENTGCSRRCRCRATPRRPPQEAASFATSNACRMSATITGSYPFFRSFSRSAVQFILCSLPPIVTVPARLPSSLARTRGAASFLRGKRQSTAVTSPSRRYRAGRPAG